MKTKQGTFTINDNLRDHSNDPFVIKKNELAKRNIEKYGLPEQLLKIREERIKK